VIDAFERGEHGGVVVPENIQEQRAGQFLLRSENMEKAAVGHTGLLADRGHRRTLESFALENREAGGQQFTANIRHWAAPNCKRH